VEEKLSDLERENLDIAFTEEEIKNVIDQMERNKAPGPDGFPVEFYQASWVVIKDDLLQIFIDFHQHKIDLARINYGTIILIPKIDEATTIQKF
jgi:mannosylglycoprotein endo-beta-mannosidase